MRNGAAAVLLSCGLAACAPEMNWREVRIEEAGLVQMFPCRPTRQQRSPMLGPTARSMVLYVCDAGQVSWALSVVDAGDAAALHAARQALADATRANLGLAGPAAPSAAGGERYRLQGRAPDGRALELVGRVDARGTHLLQWAVVGARLQSAEVEAFLASSPVAR